MDCQSRIMPPRDLNTIVTLANTWMKPKTLSGGKYASSYVTGVDSAEKKKEVNKTYGRD